MIENAGTLERDGDHYSLVFARRLSHSPDIVWRAITEDQHLKAWFPDEIHGERRVGARLRFVAESGDFEGTMLAFDPPRLMEFEWGTDTMRFAIEPTPDGCLLTVTDTFDEIGKAARDGAGWHTCLDFLEHELDGTTPPWPSNRERWSEVHPAYKTALGPDASTIGPPE